MVYQRSFALLAKQRAVLDQQPGEVPFVASRGCLTGDDWRDELRPEFLAYRPEGRYRAGRRPDQRVIDGRYEMGV